MVPVYRILTAAQWAEAERLGTVGPNDLDRASGFLHLSSQDQLHETAALYFSADPAPVALELDPDSLGDALRWEPVASRGGALFPHLYAEELGLDLVRAVIPLSPSRPTSRR